MNWAISAFCLLSLLLVPGAAAAAEVTPVVSPPEVNQITALARSPDGSVWFAGSGYSASGQDVIGRVAPSGEVTRFFLSQREQRFSGIGGIAVGRGGELWFTEPNFSRIGRVSPAGELTEIPLPLYASKPKQIVVGPDGNVWFTDGYYRVDRYDVESGAFEEFRITGGADPTGIVAGPDGAIWFAERRMGHIGRISMDGQYTRYEVPPVSHPRQIVVGPDGNLWFTDEEAPRVGRITTAGAITTFPVPVAAGTDLLSAGPGGLLWYSSGGEIGAISTRGTASAPECLVSVCDLSPDALIPGPEADLWVATGGLIGRFLPSVHVRIGRHPSRIRGRRLTLGLRCDGGVLGRPCEGALRLNVLVPRASVPRRKAPLYLQLASRRFSLPADSAARISLRLRGRPYRLIASFKSIRAWAYTTLDDGQRPSLPLTLHQ